MSRQEIDRKIRSKSGNHFRTPRRASSEQRGPGFAAAIAAALREDFGQTGSAIKTAALITGANERAVRNWFEAKNGPTGSHLVALMQHSDRVLDTVLLLAGRHFVARDVALRLLCDQLREITARLEATAFGTNSS